MVLLLQLHIFVSCFHLIMLEKIICFVYFILMNIYVEKTGVPSLFVIVKSYNILNARSSFMLRKLSKLVCFAWRKLNHYSKVSQNVLDQRSKSFLILPQFLCQNLPHLGLVGPEKWAFLYPKNQKFEFSRVFLRKNQNLWGPWGPYGTSLLAHRVS